MVAKIDSRAEGSLEIDHINLIDNASDCATFIGTIQTSLNVHDVGFVGTHSGTSACNIGVSLGGDGSGSGVQPTAQFQGYGTKVDHNFFSNISAGVLGQASVNGVVISNNTWSTTCGGVTPSTTAIALSGTLFVSTNNVIYGNLIEAMNYKYAFSFVDSPGNLMFGNTVWDQGASWAASVYLGGATAGTSSGNSCINCSLQSPYSIGQDSSVSYGNTFLYSNGPDFYGDVIFHSLNGLNRTVLFPTAIDVGGTGGNRQINLHNAAIGFSAGNGSSLWHVGLSGTTLQFTHSGVADVVFFAPTGVGINKMPTGAFSVLGLPVYANNAAAIVGGLSAGDCYRTGGDPDVIAVVH